MEGAYDDPIIDFDGDGEAERTLNGEGSDMPY